MKRMHQVESQVLPAVAEAVKARGHRLSRTDQGNKLVSEEALRAFYLKDSGLYLLNGYRAGQKVANTYLMNWILLAQSDPEQRIRPQLKSLGAITGRMSCPKGALPWPSTLHGVPVGSELRELFVAAPVRTTEH